MSRLCSGMYAPPLEKLGYIDRRLLPHRTPEHCRPQQHLVRSGGAARVTRFEILLSYDMFLRSEDRRLAAWALCLRAQEAQNYRSAEQWTDLISNHDFVTRKNDRMRATGRSAALHDKRLTLVTRARARAFQTKKI